MITVSDGPREKQIREALDAFRAEEGRLQRLSRYFRGEHDILSRARRQGLPNERLPNGFPKYIAQMSAGYMLGGGAELTYPDNKEDTDALRAFLASAADDALMMDLAVAQAVYGRGVSLFWQDGGIRLSALDPKRAFVAYDRTVARRPLLGILLCGGAVTVYDEKTQTVYHPDPGGALGTPVSRRPHGFFALPMTEYWNNGEQQGDFEDVLPLVDAYDLLQSDRMNDREQFSDALLVLTGVMGVGAGGGEQDGLTVSRVLKQEKTLALPDSDSKAEWLVKTPVERDIDVLRRAIREDIHKFSMTPDLEDGRFAGQVSGVAIRYRLFCMEQRVRIKERYFIAGLRRAAGLMVDALGRRGVRLPPAQTLDISLRRRLSIEESNKENNFS